jgi:hypothetical protein
MSGYSDPLPPCSWGKGVFRWGNDNEKGFSLRSAGGAFARSCTARVMGQEDGAITPHVIFGEMSTGNKYLGFDPGTKKPHVGFSCPRRSQGIQGSALNTCGMMMVSSRSKMWATWIWENTPSTGFSSRLLFKTGYSRSYTTRRLLGKPTK